MARLLPFALGLTLLVPALASCGGDSGPRRGIQIVQTDDGCTPAAIDLKTGEAVTFKVQNDGKKDREVEGIEGTKMDEVLVPSGRTRNIDYDAPSNAGTAKIKCYVPGGNTSIIELRVSGGDTPATAAAKSQDEGDSHSLVTTKAPADTVQVKLDSFTITTDKPSVAAGPIKFAAANVNATDVHELAVLKVKDAGTFDNTGEVENIAPLKSGEVTLDLPPGKYVLACLIAAGEAGSTKDHFAEGMKLDFEVK